MPVSLAMIVVEDMFIGYELPAVFLGILSRDYHHFKSRDKLTPRLPEKDSAKESKGFNALNFLDFNLK